MESILFNGKYNNNSQLIRFRRRERERERLMGDQKWSDWRANAE